MFTWTKPAIAERAKTVGKILKKYIPDPQIPLDHKDNFTFMVAVILSAQCTDKRVNLTTPILFKRASTPKQFAAMDENELRDIIRPCGLSGSKARNLIANAKLLLKNHAGKVPSTREELEALPGVGRKTASVLLAQIFDTPALAVDTHVLRSSNRWGLSKAKTPEAVERDIVALFPQKTLGKLSLQIILFSRQYCQAHTCKTPQTYCPMCRALRG